MKRKKTMLRILENLMYGCNFPIKPLTCEEEKIIKFFYESLKRILTE